ncbi:MAG: cytochrome c oxidase subunit 3 family protein [Phycisphaerales bacterium]
MSEAAAARGARTPQVAHHFDTLEQQQHSVTLGMWTFLATEVLFFGGLFAAYTLYRAAYPEGFESASRHLDVILGTVNTTILLGSSLTMALAVRATQLNRSRAGAGFLVATGVLGIVFLVIKGIEYAHKAHEGHIPGAHFQYEGSHAASAELFYTLYFGMTGLHATHMIGGLVVMVPLAIMGFRNRFGSHRYAPMEMFGLYWHFVDIVWIFLFPMLYLIDRT